MPKTPTTARIAQGATIAASAVEQTVSEKPFMARVIWLAQFHEWRTYHPFDSRRSTAGFPDLVLCRPPRLVFAELKTNRGRITWEQERWLATLSRVPGAEVYVWRPRAWAEIERTLQREE